MTTHTAWCERNCDTTKDGRNACVAFDDPFLDRSGNTDFDWSTEDTSLVARVAAEATAELNRRADERLSTVEVPAAPGLAWIDQAVRPENGLPYIEAAVSTPRGWLILQLTRDALADLIAYMTAHGNDGSPTARGVLDDLRAQGVHWTINGHRVIVARRP